MKRPKTPKPTMPGEMLTEEYLKPINMTQTELAAKVGVTPRTINEICNGKRAISAKMALLLADYFKTSPEYWMNMQVACDLWKEWEKMNKSKKAG